MWSEGDFVCRMEKPRYDSGYFKLIYSMSNPNFLYPVLYKAGKFEMVITEYLIEQYRTLLRDAKDNILIVGLGLGLCDLIVDSPTYIEKYQEVINNVPVKGKVIKGDACLIDINDKFDFVLNDITGYDGNCNLERFLKPDGKLVKFKLQ